ncbi:class IV adenylate cyclase [Uliginosibacterium sp. H3]|uniref:Class IV adenylate cyclase n=1 Tax=Uliginosibacterium silvisoli TaxID=3114758 RepID=A0ABU6K3N2_9RHOO|nr:class IV adenylate cyclase [Uliginosibacterium sp. H3]
MARNIEIKARVADPEALAMKAAAIADEGPVAIFQDDTFFACATGRLKLRDFGNGTGELIYYRRADQSGPKESFYLLSPTSSPENLRESLRLANGIAGRVIKHRTLYLVGQTRVHLDHVENLGHFMELEVVLNDAETIADGTRIAEELMTRLGIESTALIEGAYVDLLNRDRSHRQSSGVPA